MILLSLLSLLTLVVIFISGTAFYFFPAIIAHYRKHPQFMAITALNILFGWTIVGWGGSLVWSLTAFPSCIETVEHKHVSEGD